MTVEFEVETVAVGGDPVVEVQSRLGRLDPQQEGFGMDGRGAGAAAGEGLSGERGRSYRPSLADGSRERAEGVGFPYRQPPVHGLVFWTITDGKARDVPHG
ncbi:hypothetical protein ABZ729_15715 [Streptomyces sp. NPDC006678]|uniref:hypothetical protein n=1 Tax=Streptomyces sp. NPDC006678 TaxID=3157185 RepID=UPI0033CD1FAB